MEGLAAGMPCRLDRRSPCLLHIELLEEHFCLLDVELILEESLGFLRVE